MSDSKISALTGYTTPLDADVLPIVDTANTATKKVTWSNVKVTLKTYFDTIYTTTSAVATQITTALSGYLTTATAASTYQPLDSDLTTIAGLTATTDSFLQAKSSAWAARTIAQVKTDLGISNVDNTSDATKNSATATVTGKRNQPRIVSAASYTTDTGTSLDFSTCDIFVVTAQAGALKFNNPSGTPVHGEKIIIRVKDNGTARALTYDTQYRAIGVTLPTTTVISKTTYIGGIWNATDSKVDVIAVATEA